MTSAVFVMFLAAISVAAASFPAAGLRCQLPPACRQAMARAADVFGAGELLEAQLPLRGEGKTTVFTSRSAGKATTQSADLDFDGCTLRSIRLAHYGRQSLKSKFGEVIRFNGTTGVITLSFADDACGQITVSAGAGTVKKNQWATLSAVDCAEAKRPDFMPPALFGEACGAAFEITPPPQAPLPVARPCASQSQYLAYWSASLPVLLQSEVPKIIAALDHQSVTELTVELTRMNPDDALAVVQLVLAEDSRPRARAQALHAFSWLTGAGPQRVAANAAFIAIGRGELSPFLRFHFLQAAQEAVAFLPDDKTRTDLEAVVWPHLASTDRFTRLSALGVELALQAYHPTRERRKGLAGALAAGVDEAFALAVSKQLEVNASLLRHSQADKDLFIRQLRAWLDDPAKKSSREVTARALDALAR